ncbi:hypothetical protein I8K75_000293 [Salmonella enterica]|nr:hypothetical protein [Salmonella enterica]EGF4174747.1 hypothetical protein [Salmonella enterica]EGS2621979.1 hypothetical protein [Salmonella enterica]ELU0512731.1 hypothetical protein [Salmonella enterica]
MIFIYTTGCGHFLYRVASGNKAHFLTSSSVSAFPVAFVISCHHLTSTVTLIFTCIINVDYFLYRAATGSKAHFLTSSSVSVFPVAFRHLLPPTARHLNADFHLYNQG